jgi:uncharacterized LabA/DUF88 family protein
MQNDSERRLAVLIDADNATPKLAPAIFQEVATLGDATIRRIYGDFADQRIGWSAKIMLEHGIIPQQQFAYTKGKNASDISMVIDAMDLMHRGGLDGFCLVTSDSDFTRLAQRLREEGLAVYGLGEKKTPQAFQKACSRFIFVENLTDESAPGDERTPPSKKDPPSKAVPLLHKALSDIEDEDGWTTLGQLGKQVLHHEPAFDARTYGSSKLSDLVERTKKFEIQRPKGGGVRVRYKAR